MHWIVLAGVVGLLGWMTHSWVIAHALAELTPTGKWELVSVGWSSMWPVLLVGLVVGLIVGLVAGSKAGDLVKILVAKGEDAAREKTAKELKEAMALKASLEGKIIQAEQMGRMHGAQIAQEATTARIEAEDKARVMERRLKAMEGRLKGAQQKADRKDKALLKSRNAAKPATV